VAKIVKKDNVMDFGGKIFDCPEALQSWSKNVFTERVFITLP